jgi:transposase
MKDKKKKNRLWSGDFKLKVVLDIIENYQSILNQYISYLKRNNIKKQRRKDILNYRLYLFKSGQSETTIQKYMVVLKKFYKWARIYKDMYHLDDAYKYDIAEGVKGHLLNRCIKKNPYH